MYYAVFRGSQLTLPGPFTIKAKTKPLNIGAGACPRVRACAGAGACRAGARAGGAVTGAKRWRDDDDVENSDDDVDNDNASDAVANVNAVEDKATAYLAMMSLKAKRVCYRSEQKQAILAVYHSVNQNQLAALRIVRKKSGYEKVGRKHIYRWLRERVADFAKSYALARARSLDLCRRRRRRGLRRAHVRFCIQRRADRRYGNRDERGVELHSDSMQNRVDGRGGGAAAREGVCGGDFEWSPTSPEFGLH